MSSGARKPRVVVLGGGMAGLTTAYELTRGDWRENYESVRVFQRGWRLGGKGASSRGPNGRIEEHGLHVLLGYYQDTFGVMRDCYAELDRPLTAPDCPILTWEDAVKPAATVGLTDHDPMSGWRPWGMDFPQRVGMPGGRPALDSLSIAKVAVQSLRLLAAFYSSQHPAAGRTVPAVTVSASPHPPDQFTAAAADVLRRVGLTVLAGLVEVTGRIDGALDPAAVPGFGKALHAGLSGIRRNLYEPLVADQVGMTTWTLVDLVMTNLAGIVSDRLLLRPDGASAVDDFDYREWLERHGAAPETLDCAIIRGMYDLAFAYRDGTGEPAFSAGLGIELATRMLLDYDGSLFWKMQAGMGEVVFAPLYQVLAGRGVEFEFFHRVDSLGVDDGSIATIRMGRQAEIVAGGLYRPLIDVGGLPAWPDRPDAAQVVEYGDWLDGAESFFGERRDVAAIELHVGRDFDIVVFAASLGIVPEVCGELIAVDQRWQAMVEHVGTVATQAFQVWLKDDEKGLGWPSGAGVTLSGFADPFDTWASMSHLLESEQWPDAAGVHSIAYFCGSMADEGPDAAGSVKERAVDFLDEEVAAIWPHSVDPDGGFRWELLAAPDTHEGADRFDFQYWRANVDPSDRYVQSLPGTDRYRISPGDSGFTNLVIAGDWTDCGLNAGCVEAATRSGILAAAAVVDRARKIAEDLNGR